MDVTRDAPRPGWLRVWNTDPSVYVDDRHRAAHFRALADAQRAHLPGPGARVLDYGPGDALDAARVAEGCVELLLCEASDTIRARLRDRFAGHAVVRVLDPAALAARPGASVDLVVVHSVVQYLTDGELDRLLAEIARLLVPGGRLLLGDVVPPGCGIVADTAALLRYAVRERFLPAALWSLVRTAVSPYARLRAGLGLARHDEAGLRARLVAAGLPAERVPNPGHHPRRTAFLARRAEQRK